MVVLEFLKNYWFLITFVGGLFIALFKQLQHFREYQNLQTEAIKCNLRNDILTIYDKCKEEKRITKYELQAIEFSYKSYKALNGNSFVDDIHELVKTYEIKD